MKYDTNIKYEAEQAKTKLNYLIDKGKLIDLKEIRAKRSISLNSYYHVCVSLYAVHFGHTFYESKIDLKRLCPFMTYINNGKMYLVETSKQDSKELSLFVEWIRNYSAKGGCYIPDAEEYLMNKYAIDKDIESNKTYL